jgi:NADPH:quinone reductase-like Zn-dependent oxidoreductase
LSGRAARTVDLAHLIEMADSRIPKRMRAAVIDEFGGPEVFQLRELPVPDVDADEVLIGVHTAGVGSWDPDMRSGWVPSGKPHFPIILGSDGSGTVVAKGSRARRFKVGDRVYANTFDNPKGGSYADFVVVPADNVAPVPAKLDTKSAGALAISGLTALQGLEALGLKRGQRIIITGASGAVGTVAVQLAKARGASVFALASGKDGRSLVRRLGVDVAVDGKAANWDRDLDAFAPDGVDAVLVLAAGDFLARCFESLHGDGRVVYPNGVDPIPKKRGLDIVSYNGEGGASAFTRLNRAVIAARLKVPIAAAFRFGQVAQAHKKVAGHVLGKVVLRIG